MELTQSWLPAAVIAALVTSVVNLLVARGTRKAQHGQWLIGRKQEVYVQFLDARREMMNHAKRAADVKALVDGRKELLGPLRPTAISLLAPTHISELADDIYSRTKDLIDTEHPVLWNPLVESKADSIRQDCHELEALMRADLDREDSGWSAHPWVKTLTSFARRRL